MCCDERLRKGVAQYTRPEDVLFRYPQLRLTFWLYEPISKAIFKIVGPLFLVVSLMLVGVMRLLTKTHNTVKMYAVLFCGNPQARSSIPSP